MTRHTTTLWFTLAVFTVVTGHQLHAEEFGSGAQATQTTPTATAPQAEDAAQITIAIPADDPGVAAIYRAQNIPQTSELFRADVNARKILQDWANANKFSIGMGEGNEGSRYIIVIASAGFNTNDPATDPNFALKREKAARMAVITAKDDIISSIHTSLSATEQLRIPGHNPYAELTAEDTAIQVEIEAQRREVVKLLEFTDKAEAEALKGATTRDRINALLEAAIRKLGQDFDAGKIAADKRDEYERLKSAHADAKGKYDDLVKRAEAIKTKVVQTFTSESSRRSALTLCGATAIQQAESWDPVKKMYDVAVLICWSHQLQRAALATLAGDATVISRPRALSVQEYLQSIDLGTKIGPWQYIDNKGSQHFLGIAARPASDDAVTDRRNRRVAQEAARIMATFSLFADVESEVSIQLVSEDYKTGNLDQGTQTRFSESFDESLMQKIKDLNVSGLAEVASVECNHRLTGLPIHVSVFAISPQNAALAMKIRQDSIGAAIRANRNQEYQRGQNQEWNRQLEASRNNAEARAAGAADVRATTNEAQKAPLAPTKQVPNVPPAKPGQKPPASVPGAVIGGTVDIDL